MALPSWDILAPQTVRKAICLTLASAGINIPIKHGTRGRRTTGKAIPVTAMPVPFSCPLLCEIFTKLTMPKIIAGMAVRKQVKGLRIARISAAMAIPLALVWVIGACAVGDARTALHELHIWSLSSQEAALSCHVGIREDDFGDGPDIIKAINGMLKRQFNIGHGTIQIETHECGRAGLLCRYNEHQRE